MCRRRMEGEDDESDDSELDDGSQAPFTPPNMEWLSDGEEETMLRATEGLWEAIRAHEEHIAQGDELFRLAG